MVDPRGPFEVDRYMQRVYESSTVGLSVAMFFRWVTDETETTACFDVTRRLLDAAVYGSSIGTFVRWVADDYEFNRWRNSAMFLVAAHKIGESIGLWVRWVVEDWNNCAWAAEGIRTGFSIARTYPFDTFDVALDKAGVETLPNPADAN